MSRNFLLLVAFSALLPRPLWGQKTPSASATDVAYVVGSGGTAPFTITTYTVDPGTGRSTQQGNPFSLPMYATDVVASADDHFVYALAFSGISKPHIWAFTTDSNGAPTGRPIETLAVTRLQNFEVDPNGNFAYGIRSALDRQGNGIETIVLWSIDPVTGLLTKKSELVASFPPNGPCGMGWSTNAYLTFGGFDRTGSKLYYLWECDYWGDYAVDYYYRAIDTYTGTLGPENEMFSWADSGGTGDEISFTEKSLIDFYYSGGFSGTSVSVYPPTGGSDALFSCDQTMLEACGNSLTLYADPAGEYLFFQIDSTTSQIAKIKMAEHRIVNTGNYTQPRVLTMSPDRTLLYGVGSGDGTYCGFPVFTFDTKTGAVQQGGNVYSSTTYCYLLTTVRE